MGLLQEIRDESNRRVSACKFGKLLETLSAEDRAEIEQALAEPMVSLTAVVRVLNNHGHKIGLTVCHKHQQKECNCVNK